MLISFFENAYFLRSLGWAIVNNLWQTGLMWILYQLIVILNPTLSARVKYYYSLCLLFISFFWFVFTLVFNIQNPVEAGISAGNLSPDLLHKLSICFPIFATIYCLFLVYFSFKLLVQIANIHFIKNNGLQNVREEIAEFVNTAALQLKIKQKIAVYLSIHIEVPSVIGILKPVILLPLALMNNLTYEQINAVLTHEIAHIKRNDFLINMLQSVVELTLFFNPFAIMLGRSIKRERENCCDDEVLKFNFNKQVYAKALLVLEEQRRYNIPFALAATDNKNLLLKRIKRLFSTPQQPTSVSQLQKLLLFAGGFFLLGIIVLSTIFLPLNVHNSGKITSGGIDRSWIIPAKILIENEVAKQPDFAFQKKLETIKTKLISNQIEGKSILKSQQVSLKKTKMKGRVIADKGFLVTLINEDLFKMSSKKMKVISISDNNMDSLKMAFVTIQEQQSGTKNSKTYLLKLSKKNGKQIIQPLIIVNKYNDSANYPVKTKMSDTSKLIKVSPKRRVTT